MTATQTIAARIAELSADALVATDEGTHGRPETVRVYERLDGTRYGVRYHGGVSVGAASPDADSQHGRMRRLPAAGAARRRAEIVRLREELDAARSRDAAEARAAASLAAFDARPEATHVRAAYALLGVEMCEAPAAGKDYWRHASGDGWCVSVWSSGVTFAGRVRVSDDLAAVERLS